jgi:hypothetical protein
MAESKKWKQNVAGNIKITEESFRDARVFVVAKPSP